jgi:sec-independent protein translocase protein TatA
MALLHPTHLALVALVALVVFGPRKLPELARGAGEAWRELNRTLRGGQDAEPDTVRASAAPLPGRDA